MNAELKYRTLCTTQLMIAVSRSSPLSQLERVSNSDLERYPFIFHNDPFIINSVKKLFSDKIFEKTLGYFNDNSLLKRMIADGHAIGIYTRLLENIDSYTLEGKIVLKPFECDEGMDQIALLCCYNKKKQISLVEQDFLKILMQETGPLR